MRFGVCGKIDDAASLARAGFDYIELGVQPALQPRLSDEAWKPIRETLDAMPIRPEAFNLFVPGDLKIVGDFVDPRLVDYASVAIERAALVGGKIIVLGSGGARQIPDGLSETVAMAQLREFLEVCADAADGTGVTVVLEPLGLECNLIRSVREGAELVRRINRVEVKNLADTWHMDAIGEGLEEIVASGDVLAHAHTAGPGRKGPGAGHDFVPLLRALRLAKYDARLSLECSWDDLEAEAKPALVALKSSAARAGG